MVIIIDLLYFPSNEFSIFGEQEYLNLPIKPKVLFTGQRYDKVLFKLELIIIIMHTNCKMKTQGPNYTGDDKNTTSNISEDDLLKTEILQI